MPLSTACAQVLLLGGATHAAARRLAQAAPPSAQPGSDGTTPVAFYGSGFLIEYYVRVMQRN